MKFEREHVWNIFKELKPDAVDARLLTSLHGKIFADDTAVIRANGRQVSIGLGALSEAYRKDGYPGVRALMREVMCSHLDYDWNDIDIGPHDFDRLRDQQLRKLNKRAWALEFAMKSAGSSDEEIYRWLKDV